MHFSYPQTYEPFTFLNLKIWILVIFKFALASQVWPSCPYKPLRCQTVRYSQFLSKFQSPKFEFSGSGKYVKGSYVWGYGKFISAFWKKLPLHIFVAISENLNSTYLDQRLNLQKQVFCPFAQHNWPKVCTEKSCQNL